VMMKSGSKEETAPRSQTGWRPLWRPRQRRPQVEAPGPTAGPGIVVPPGHIPEGGELEVIDA